MALHCTALPVPCLSSACSLAHRSLPRPWPSQYYFETIFPRIPKPVQDNINEELKSRGLPTTAKGNGGAGGADRRGMDDSSTRRPASVKASLSVAFGQRAPNRSGTREEGRGRDPSLHERDAGRGRGSASPEPPRDRGDRDRGYDRDGGRREVRRQGVAEGREPVMPKAGLLGGT